MSVRLVIQIQIFGLQFHHALNYFMSPSYGLPKSNSAGVQQVNNHSFFLCCADFPALILSAKNLINTITCAWCLALINRMTPLRRWSSTNLYSLKPQASISIKSEKGRQLQLPLNFPYIPGAVPSEILQLKLKRKKKERKKKKIVHWI